jgi:hypothetical protein
VKEEVRKKKKRIEEELRKIIKTRKDNCFPFTYTPALYRKTSHNINGLLRESPKRSH